VRIAQRSLALRPAHSRGHLYVTCYTEGFSHFVSSMTAPVASGWSGCRWGLHPLESAALSRRTREADIPDREGGRCSWGKAAVVGVVSTGQGSGKPDEEYLPEFDLTLGLLRRLMAADGAKFLRCKGCESENREGRKFCASCGSDLPVACRECGYANEGGDRYCGACGHLLAGTDVAPRAEGRMPRPAGDGISRDGRPRPLQS
jgi:Double zinc ribbon